MNLASLGFSFLDLDWSWWLNNLADWLPMSPLEIVATIFGLWSVWCYVKESVWSWPTGLINVALYILLFYNVHLYCETGLQVIFVGLQLYGWWEWVYGGADKKGVKIETTPADGWLVLGLAAVAGIYPLGWLLTHYTQSTTPWWDTIPTVLSLVAQYMLTKKWIENWFVWIVVDLFSIPLFAYKGLYLTSGLYFLFLVLCIKGYQEWKRLRAPVLAAA